MHPWDRNEPHSWVPGVSSISDVDLATPAGRALRRRYQGEIWNWRLMLKVSNQERHETFELQDLLPHQTFSLKDLHSFCNVASGMYAIADMRYDQNIKDSESWVTYVYQDLYRKWFTIAESNTTYNFWFFTRFMQTEGLDIDDIVARHKALGYQLEMQMSVPIERNVPGDDYHERYARDYHDQATMLPCFKNLVIVFEEFRKVLFGWEGPAILLVLDVTLAQGIPELEGAVECEIAGQKVVKFKALMEQIMCAVVAMQHKSMKTCEGIRGWYRND